MASPQAENGHTDIANELLEQLYRAGLSGTELSLCLMVIRKTYGWHKKQDAISIGQFQKGINQKNRKVVIENLKKLVTKKLLLVTKSELATGVNTYQFNKNYEEWVVTKKTLGSYQKVTRVVTKKTLELVTKKLPTKEKKETIQKKEKINKKENFSNPEWLVNIPPNDLTELATKFDLDETSIASKGESLYDWYLSNPRRNRKDNWKATLRMALRKDAAELRAKSGKSTPIISVGKGPHDD